MSIRVVCPSCQSALHAPDHAAGRNAKCPTCGETLVVPGITESPAVVAPSTISPSTPVTSPSPAAETAPLPVFQLVSATEYALSSVILGAVLLISLPLSALLASGAGRFVEVLLEICYLIFSLASLLLGIFALLKAIKAHKNSEQPSGILYAVVGICISGLALFDTILYLVSILRERRGFFS
jgi:hypothetical protein